MTMTLSPLILRKGKLLVLACFFPLVLTAQPRVYTSSTPDWVDESANLNLKLDARQVSEGYYFKFYDYQIHAEEGIYYSHFVREIVTEAGVQSGAEIWVSFAPDYQRLSFHEISVIRNGKKISQLDVKKIKVIATEQEASSFLYNGNYSAYLILDDIRVGDQIEYAYSIKGTNPVFQDKFFEDIYLQLGVPVSQLYVSVLVSEDREVKMKTFNGADEPQVSSNKGMVRMTWEDQLVAAPEFESYAPQWYDYFRHVQLSEYTDWGEVAAWARSINAVPEAIQGELLKKSEQLLGESQGDKARYAHKAIRFVQDDIRYTGIEIGAYSHRANHPEKVLKQRYGDCKDKSLLLVALLKEAGIEADMALLHTRLGTKIRDQLPSPAAFNHVIVRFQLDGRPYWVDPTVSYQGGSLENLSQPQSTSALLLNAADNPMVPVSFNQKGKIVSVETYAVSPSDSTAAMLAVETIYTGWQADQVRAQIAYSSIQGLESNYLDYYSRLYPDIELIDSLHVLDDRPENKIVVKEKYQISDFLTKNEETENLETAFYAGLIAEQLPAVSGKRKSPIAINYPVNLEYTIQLIHPRLWNVPSTRFFMDRSSYLFGHSAKRSGDTLVLNYQFLYHRAEVDADKSSQFAADINTFQNNYLSYLVAIPPFHLGVSVAITAVLVYHLILFAVFVFVGYWVYRFKVHSSLQEDLEMHRSLGGWLLIPLIWMVLLSIIGLVGLLGGLYRHTFVRMLQGQELPFQGLMFFRLTTDVFLVSFAVFCLILALRRRVVFPQFAVWFFLVSAGVQLIYYLGLNAINTNQNFSPWGSLIYLLLAGLMAGIWVPYMLRSKRVKGTFIRP